MLKRVLLPAAVLFLMAAAAPGAEEEYPPEIQRILDRGKLIVALTRADHPPFFWFDAKDRKFRGFDVEMAEEIAVGLGLGRDAVEFNRQAASFNEVVDVVHGGEADLAVCKLSATLSRSRKLLFSDPYVVLRKGLLINRLRFARLRRGREPAEAIRNFQGRVAVIRDTSYEGYAAEMFLRNKNDAAERERRIVPKENWEEVVRAVESGEVDAAFRDELEVKKIFKQRPDAALRLQSVVFKDTQDPIAVAVSWKSAHLHKWLQQFLPKYFSEHLRLKETAITADELLDRYPEIFEEEEPAGQTARGDAAAPAAPAPAEVRS
jgi:ABC-type amino acid transport substrate-binding protein